MKTIRGHHFGRAAVFAALLLFVAMAFQMVTLSSAQKAMRQDTLKLITASGTHAFTIEIAEKDEDKARGLMFRNALADDKGMVFPFTETRMASFWMKNTFIPLDIIFVRADGSIENIAMNTIPYSTDPVESTAPVAAVLELRGGLTAELGIKAGDKVRWTAK